MQLEDYEEQEKSLSSEISMLKEAVHSRKEEQVGDISLDSAHHGCKAELEQQQEELESIIAGMKEQLQDCEFLFRS